MIRRVNAISSYFSISVALNIFESYSSRHDSLTDARIFWKCKGIKKFLASEFSRDSGIRPTLRPETSNLCEFNFFIAIWRSSQGVMSDQIWVFFFGSVCSWIISNGKARDDSISDYQRPESERYSNQTRARVLRWGAWDWSDKQWGWRLLQGQIELANNPQSGTRAMPDLSDRISEMLKEWPFISCEWWSWHRKIAKDPCLPVLHESLRYKNPSSDASSTRFMRARRQKIGRARGIIPNPGSMPT
jgi:hypothetical protein